MARKSRWLLPLLITGALALVSFQNCGPANFSSSDVAGVQSQSASSSSASLTIPAAPTAAPSIPSPSPTPTAGTVSVCNGVSCSLDPLTTRPAVTTILMALGDQANQKLVINGASSQLVAETIVRTSTAVANPRILVAWDTNASIESAGDLNYITKTLLSRYNVTTLDVPASGLTANDLKGFDLVWFSNPGYPMESSASRDALLAFAGGVVLEGDDLSQGKGFSLESLTGLHYVDNGTSVLCNGKFYGMDNNSGSQYGVSLDSTMFPGANASTLSFNYGNDLDNTTVSRAGLQVYAWAKADPSDCVDKRPAVVRYVK